MIDRIQMIQPYMDYDWFVVGAYYWPRSGFDRNWLTGYCLAVV